MTIYECKGTIYGCKGAEYGWNGMEWVEDEWVMELERLNLD
jgi:hypothetical protein